LAEVRGAERSAPAASEGQILDRHPVEADLRIAGAAEIAVLVMTPGGLELQSPQPRYGVHVAEDGDVQLRERRPDRPRLILGRFRAAGGGHGYRPAQGR